MSGNRGDTLNKAAIDQLLREFGRTQESVGILTGERGGEKKLGSAVLRSEFQAIGSLDLKSTLISGVPTADQYNALRVDVANMFATMKRIAGQPYIPNIQIIAGSAGGGSGVICIVIAISDETSAFASGAAKVTFRMPFAFTLSAVRASLTTAQASGSILTFDINEAGTSILSTKLTIDNTEKTSTTAATPAVISDTALADDAEMTIDVDQIGNGTAAGGKIYLIGTSP